MKTTVFVALLLAVFMPACSSGNGDTTNNVSPTITNLPEAPNVSDENGLKQGLWQETVGDERYVGRYVNDQRQGEWKSYLTGTGALRRIINYLNNMKHGKETLYRSGVINHVVSWDMGVKNGKEIRYFDPPDQNIEQILTTWSNDMRNGTYTFQVKRSDNGNILRAHHGTYTNGVKTGYWEEGEIKANGTINPIETGSYNQQGRRTGEWTLLLGGVHSGYSCDSSAAASERLEDDTGCMKNEE